MKRIFIALFFIFISFFSFAEMRYVEINSISNATIVKLKKLEDLEFIIGKHNVSVAFFQSSSGDLLVNADGTYFSFWLNGYWTIDDYKKGTAAGFKNGSDFSDAEFHCIESSELYYFFKSNSFNSVEDCTDARKNGFSRASEFYDAQTKGFSTNADYQKARSYNLQDKSSFEKFCEIEDSIERIVSSKAVDKRQAFIFHFLARLPKGESAISVLPTSLRNLYDATPTDVKNALYMYINITNSSNTRNRYNDYNRRNSYQTLDYLFNVDSLKQFFASVDASELGTYSSQTEIFKRNGSKPNFPAAKKAENGTNEAKSEKKAGTD